MSAIALTPMSCPLCYKNFDNTTRLPRMIPTCGHSICESCIQRNLIESQQTFRCPIDGEIVVCARGNVELFAKNVAVINAISNHQVVYMRNERYNDFAEETTKKPTILPEVMFDVMELKKQLQHNEDEVKRSQQQFASQHVSLSPVTLVCDLHHKIMDLGCILCQEKICSHCAIFGDHKSHVVVPEDEVKTKNMQGMTDMKSIQDNIESTRLNFFQTMEENFEFNICKQIEEKKQTFFANNRHKHQEYQKMLTHAEQRSSEQIEKFFSEIEEKFRKFKNHNFTETYEKIHSFNKMVDEFELQNDNLAEKAELNFDFYLNHDKLIATAKDIELEFNNLLEFPLKLVNNYLNNISIAFADQIIANAYTNVMSLAYLQPENDVIQQSIQNLTLANQREILLNSPFNKHLLEKLSTEEIQQILTSDVPLTPSQAFFHQQSEISQKQQYSIVPPQLNPPQPTSMYSARRASSSQDSRRSIASSYGQRGTAITSKNNLRESKAEVNLDNVNQVISEMSQVRQKKTLLNSFRESSIGQKDKMLLSHIETQEEFLKNTQFNGSFFQSVIVPDPIISAFQNRQMQSQFEAITTSTIGQKQQAQEQSMKQPESHTGLFVSSNVGQRGQKIEHSNIIYAHNSTPSKQQDHMGGFPISPRPSTKKISGRDEKQSASYSTLNARTHQKSTSPLSSHRSGLKTPTRSTSPISQSSQVSQKSSAPSYMRLEDLSSRPLVFDNQKLSSEPVQLSVSKTIGLKYSNSTKNNSMKIIKSHQFNSNITAQKQGLTGSSAAERNLSSSQLGSSSHLRKSAAVNFKKKSEKFQETIQRLRAHEIMDVLELVNEEINDLEAEELANELSRSQSNLESIKLVKNKIGNIGLKAILEGLIKGGHAIHTINLTNNICNEYCFFDLLRYIELNPHLKNIYLQKNSIQLHKNKEQQNSIRQCCNLHL